MREERRVMAAVRIQAGMCVCVCVGGCTCGGGGGGCMCVVVCLCVQCVCYVCCDFYNIFSLLLTHFICLFGSFFLFISLQLETIWYSNKALNHSPAQTPPTSCTGPLNMFI